MKFIAITDRKSFVLIILTRMVWILAIGVKYNIGIQNRVQYNSLFYYFQDKYKYICFGRILVIMINVVSVIDTFEGL